MWRPGTGQSLLQKGVEVAGPGRAAVHRCEYLDVARRDAEGVGDTLGDDVADRYVPESDGAAGGGGVEDARRRFPSKIPSIDRPD
jgi:hypothetical protein